MDLYEPSQAAWVTGPGNVSGWSPTVKRLVLRDPDRRTSYVFRLNPEDLKRDMRARVNVVHTADGAYVDHYGAAVGHLTLGGTTGGGYGPEFETLRNLVEDWQRRVREGRKPRLLELHNATDEQSYEVVVLVLRSMRSARAPLLYRYEMEMAILRDSVPKRQEVVVLASLTSSPGDLP
jgi:hypothetical protein